MKKAVFCILICVWLPKIGWASDAYDYASAAIDALNVVKEATSTPPVVNSTAGNPTDEFVTTVNASMKSAVSQARAFSIARSKVDPFSNSNDTEIRQSVALFAAALYLLQVNSEERVAAYETLLNNFHRSLDAPGTVMRRVLELQEDGKTAWDAYAKAGIAISYPLADSAKSSNGTIHYLKISQVERERLKSQLVEAFGLSIKSGIDSTTPMNRIPAAALWQFLNDRWESADAKP